MPAQALVAIVYFQLDDVLYEHTIDPREVDTIYLQRAALDRFVGGRAVADAASASSTSTGVPAGGRPADSDRRPGVPHHATREELTEMLAGKRPRSPIASSGPPPCFPSEGSIRVVNPADVPGPARRLLDLPPGGDLTGGCIHCNGCGSWCPD